MRVDNPIKVEGLRDLQRALKQMDGETQKQLRVVLNKAAAVVVAEAQPKVPTRTGKAARSMKAASGQREAVVKAGGSRVPYYPWLDFGGAVGRGRSGRRPFKPEGRYIYPAYRRNRTKIYGILGSELAVLVKRAGLRMD